MACLEFTQYNPVGGKKIWYSIRQSTKESEDPHDTDHYYIEKDAEISCSASSSEVKLSWGVIIDSKKNTKLNKITYDVYVALAKTSNMSTSCSMKLTGAIEIKREYRKNSITWQIPSEFKGKDLTFNIIAHIPEFGQVISYNPVVFYYNKSSYSFFFCMIIIYFRVSYYHNISGCYWILFL